MPPLSYSGYRFPPDIIQRAVWMDLRFTLSFRDVEELLAERGIVVTYESIRRWVLTFGPAIARKLRARRPRPHGRWHLDEMATLSAKSGGDLLQGSKARHPRLGARMPWASPCGDAAGEFDGFRLGVP